MKKIVAGILAHVDSGKTTLSEALMYCSGNLSKLGRVDHGDSFLDNFALERQRGITIFSKQALLNYGDTRFTLLDTPGHVDFSAETERTLQILDYAVLVISGTDGVQSHTLTLWKLLSRYNVPVFMFINKMDLPGASRETGVHSSKPSSATAALTSVRRTQTLWRKISRSVTNHCWSAMRKAHSTMKPFVRLYGTGACFPLCSARRLNCRAWRSFWTV